MQLLVGRAVPTRVLPPTDLHITLHDSTQVELLGAVARADTLRGTVDGDPRLIPMNDVSRIERKGGMRTAAVFGLASLAIVLGIGAAS